MYDAILAWLEAHPELAGVFAVAVVWPALSGLASFADGWLAKRYPVALAVGRALGFDLKRLLAILFSRALESRKLPVPPEVVELRFQRVDKAIARESSKHYPPPPPAAGRKAKP